MSLSPASLSIASKSSSTLPSGVSANESRAYAIKLKSDLSRLRQVRSLELRQTVKADVLMEYQDYLKHFLVEQKPLNRQDDVLIWCALWSVDVGQFKQALALALLVIEAGMKPPEGFKRSLAEIFTETLSAYCLSDNPRRYVHELEVLKDKVQSLDMIDVIKAKLFKALGVAYLEMNPDLAKQYLERAYALHVNSGVKPYLKRLELGQSNDSKPLTKAQAALVEKQFTMSTAKAAKLVGVAVATFLKMARLHPDKLPFITLSVGSGTGFRFDPNDVERFKNSLIVSK